LGVILVSLEETSAFFYALLLYLWGGRMGLPPPLLYELPKNDDTTLSFLFFADFLFCRDAFGPVLCDEG